MPSEKVLKEKQATVKEIAAKLKSATSGVLVDYRGINVAKDTALRTLMRNANVDYSVIKNTLTLLAAREVGFDTLDEVLHGTTALAVSMTDPVLPAKILCKFAKENDFFKIKAGFVDGKVIGIDEVNKLAELPDKEVLIAQVLGGLNAPITGFVTVLNGNLKGLVVALNAIAEQKSA